MTIDDIRRIIAEHADIDIGQVQPAHRLDDDLGLDSLDLIEVAMLIEDKTGIHLEDSEIIEIRTPQDLFDAITKKEGTSA